MPQVGGSLVKKAKAFLSNAHKFAKQEKVLSKFLDSHGHSKLASVARIAGYGKGQTGGKRRRRKKVVR